MTLSKKTNALGKAIAATMLAGGMMASQNALAIPEAPANLGDTYVSNNDMGQALIFPYYTVNGGFKTNFSIFNTSDTHAIAVKINIREYANSRDVKNFVVVLSPNDKWAANIASTDRTDGPNVLNMRDGVAELRTSDTSCTVPAIMDSNGNGTLFDASSYTGDMARMQQGYITVTPMGRVAATAGDLIYNAALHVQPAGVPANCAAVRGAFAPTVTWRNGSTTITNGSPAIAANPNWEAIPVGVNPLFGELVLLNETGIDSDPSNNGGLAGGTNAVALADWMIPANGTLFTAQAFPFNNEPTIASRDGLWTATGAEEVDVALSSRKVINEWAFNTGNGALTDWVVTFPTKGFHTDGTAIGGTNPYAHRNQYRVGYPAAIGSWTEASSDVAVSVEEFDREEGTTVPGGKVYFSPGTYEPDPMLRYEANTVTFSGSTVVGGSTPVKSVLNSDNPLILDPKADINDGAAKVESSGYATFEFFANNADQQKASLPVVGFVMKERNIGDNTKAYGQILDHKFEN